MAVVPLQEQLTEGRRGLMWDLLHNRSFTVGATIFLAMLLVSLIAGLFIPPQLKMAGSFPPRQPPLQDTLLGTTALGQSVAIQLTEAIPNSILIGLIAATVGTVLGALIGFTAGYFGGWIDNVLRMLIDVFLSVPSLLFLILISALVRSVNVVTLALIIGAFAWPSPAPSARPGPQPQGTRLRAAGAALGYGRHGDHRARADPPHGTVVGRQLRQRLYRRRAGRVGSVDYWARSRSAR